MAQAAVLLGPKRPVGGPLDPLKPAAEDGHIRIGARNLDPGPLIDPLATIAPEEEPLVTHMGPVGPVLDGLEADGRAIRIDGLEGESGGHLLLTAQCCS